MRRRVAQLLLYASCSLGCGTQAAEKTAQQPTPGPMPKGGAWRGLYQGPYHIALSIWTEGSRARGNWRAVGGREGDFFGTVVGNLLVMDWTERASSSSERWSGHGYFVYDLGKTPSAPAHLYGEWGIGRGGRLNPWWAIKRAPEPLTDRSRAVDADDADDDNRDVDDCGMGACEQDQERE